jgi:hypothetical protein
MRAKTKDRGAVFILRVAEPQRRLTSAELAPAFAPYTTTSPPASSALPCLDQKIGIREERREKREERREKREERREKREERREKREERREHQLQDPGRTTNLSPENLDLPSPGHPSLLVTTVSIPDI